METYRSGHNGAHSKCVSPPGHEGSNPSVSAKSLSLCLGFFELPIFLIHTTIKMKSEETAMKPIIKKENVKTLFESKFIKVFDLQYEEGKHYYDATRRPLERITAVKSDEEFKKMLPDAVTCVVILQVEGKEPKLLLTKEYRYPTGHFLLSPPAGLLDPEDENASAPVLSAAKREIEEETGITLNESDTLSLINPLLFSSPGMTDESNALVCALVNLKDLSSLSQKGAIGSECFDGFCLLSSSEAKEILKAGRDQDGIFYSVYTWAALMYFVSDLWR